MDLGDVAGVLVLAYFAYLAYGAYRADRELGFIAALGFMLVLAAFVGRYVGMDSRVGTAVVVAVVAVLVLFMVKR